MIINLFFLILELWWYLPSFQCLQVIENSLEAAKQLIADVDLQLLVHNQYGKGFMKVCRISPDAYIQLALQLAYYRVDVHLLFTLYIIESSYMY